MDMDGGVVMDQAYNLSSPDYYPDYAPMPMDMNGFQRVKDFYSPFHGFLSLIVCFFGIIANVANIIVLTRLTDYRYDIILNRKEMVTPTNSILTGLAVADMLVMVDYIPYTIHNYIRQDRPITELYTYGWAIFALFHAHFSVICHTISTWLTVLLAVWRYIAVRHPVESKVWCSKDRTSYFIAGTYVAVIIACIPGYMTFTIITESLPFPVNAPTYNATLYKVGFSPIAQAHDGFLMTVHFWIFSVATKLAPCILLTYLSLTLIKALIEADKRKKRLKSNRPTAPSSTPQPTPTITANPPSTPYVVQQGPTEHGDHDGRNAQTPTSQTNSVVAVAVGTNGTKTSYKSTLAVQSNTNERTSTSSGQQSSSSGHRESKHAHHGDKIKDSTSSQNDRTNRMLIAVLLLFLLTEFPSGILVLLSGIIGDSFFENVYSPLGELMDILALVNSSINFILYCSMSTLFRKTFINIFCKCFIRTSVETNESTPLKSMATRNTIIKISPPLESNRRGTTTTAATFVINNSAATINSTNDVAICVTSPNDQQQVTTAL